MCDLCMSLTAADVISIGLVITTIGLLSATVYYAIQTRRLVQVTDKARIEGIQPIIKAFFSFIGPVFVVLRIQNVGRGAALEFGTTIDIMPKASGFPEIWKEQVLDKDMHRDFFLPDGYIDNISASIDFALVKGSFKDLLGDRKSFEEKIDAKEFCKMVKQSKVRLDFTLTDHVKDIAKNTQNIDKHLDSISDEMKELSKQIKGAEESKLSKANNQKHSENI